MTPKEIARLLANRAEDVCRELLPNGKRDNGAWKCGSVDGETGKSLSVVLQGEKVGRWTDFADSDHYGDLIDLWAAARGLSLHDAMNEAKAYLGVKDPVIHGQKKKSYTAPQRPKCKSPEGAELAWLIQERKLKPEAIKAYQVGAEGGKVYFPFMRDGKLVMCKWRSITTKDTMPTSKNQEPCLFGWQAIPKTAREVTICEGEIDAISLWQYGYPALSVPFGGGKGAKQDWIENDYEYLERFDVINICMDADPVGREGAKEIIERLGRERCRLINLPDKDANDCLKNGVPPEMITRAFRMGVYMDPEELKPASDYYDEILLDLHPDRRPQGNDSFFLPWNNTHEKVEFRMGDLTILNGVNGHGKSQIVGHIQLAAMRQGRRVCVASMELRPPKLLSKMVRQAAGLTSGLPADGYVEAITNWFNDKLWVFECIGTAKTNRILEVFKYARKRHGINVFVIDSLMKCGIDEDDYNSQKRFVDQLCDFKNEHNVHIILLAHSRKGESEDKPSGKMDVKGTGAITDLTDNLFTIWRNKKKERELDKLLKEDPEADIETANGPGAMLFCYKQRNGDWEGSIPLWFCTNSYQYMPGPDMRPFQFVDYSGAVEEAA